ncbi:LysR family transcriptional regulator [Streptomyces sp. RG38]|uniref:LysR family transcriptional regulator n=1 Tax=Streptomyces tagetis TaxID=2820809 RepID=A0A941B5Y4_9ACTN|nr:LysR family transcriptional regulator [Streptomyces sp. RG38]MBQ0825823.1 LysR family transcriptional regulator [Streptomyces sp. RG38]
MELRTLRYFVAVAEAESVSAAAERISITQPALSRQMRELERELKVVLFDRRTGRLRLSAAGRQFLDHARDVLHSADVAVGAAETISAGRLVRVTIAAPSTTLTDVVAPFIATFGPGDPLPSVVETDGPKALETLYQGTDLALVTHAPPAQWRSLAVAVFPMFAYVPPDHPKAAHRVLDLPELLADRLILLDHSFRPRLVLQEALTARGLMPRDVVECGNAQVAQALAAAGRGVAVVSDDPRFGLVGVPLTAGGAPLGIRLFAAWDPAHHAAGLLADMARRLQDHCVARYGTGVLP